MRTLFLIFSILLLSLSGCSINNSTPENHNNSSNYEVQKQLANNISSTNNTFSDSKELYRFSTNIYTKTFERQNNVKICCNQLNEHIVSSGEIFSFCDTLRTCKARKWLSKGRNF